MGQIGRPDVVKRWFLQIPTFYDESFNSAASFLHLYAITGFTEGAVYEIDNCESQGMSREQTAEVLAIAFLHAISGHGMYGMLETLTERLRVYKPKTTIQWPDHWGVDPDAFKSGLDFSTMELLDGELELLSEWYTRWTGEVPLFVPFLGKHRPKLLKSYRNRWEHVVKSLPKQMLPWLQLNWEVIRGHETGIREAVLMCKGFGCTKAETMNAIAWAMLSGAHGSMSNVARAAGDVFDLEDWE
jgi:hypothetical protein